MTWRLRLLFAWVGATSMFGCAQPPNPGTTAAESATPPSATLAPSGTAVSSTHGVTHAARHILPDGKDGGLVVVTDGTVTRKAMPGRVGQLALVGSRLLVTTMDPSLLIALDARDLSEQKRAALPPGADGFAITPAGEALVVSRDANQLSLVGLQSFEVKWSVPVGAAPRDVLVRPDGSRAWITHRIGSGVSVLLPEGEGWSQQPRVTAALVGAQRVEGRAVGLADGRAFIAHGLLTEGPSTARPELALADSGAPRRWHMPSLPAGAFIRTLNVHASRVFAATDDMLFELSSSPDADAIDRIPHRCPQPIGMAVSENAVVLSCADGQIAEVALPLSDKSPVAYRGAEAHDPCEGVTPDDAPISNSYKTEFLSAPSVEKVLRRYHCRYPARTHLFPIATTHGKRTVWALAIGREPKNHDRPTIFINGGHHGDELMAASFALDALQALLEDNVADGALRDIVFVVAPLVNPDGNHHRLVEHLLGRKNGRDNDQNGTRDHEDGVDLNRNYPFRWGSLGENGSRSKETHKWFRGPKAGSEPETQGVMRLANSEKFVASMSFHTGTLALCAPYTIPNVKQPDPDAAWIVAHEITSQMPPHPEGHIPVKRRLYPLDGNDQDWHRHQNGTLAFLWEGAKHWLAHRRVQLMAPARASWMLLAKRFANGPSVSVRTRDAAGKAVQAEIAFEEIRHHEGERWTTRCRDGRFDYILPRAGTYTVRVSAAGKTVKREVKVGRGERPTLDIMLPVLVDRPAACPTPNTDAGKPATYIALP